MLEGRFDEMRRKYAGRAKSQFGQDAFVLAVLGERTGGYFVDVGAGDGVNPSNTHLLEAAFGWRGLLVEPNPAFTPRSGRGARPCSTPGRPTPAAGSPSRSSATRSCRSCCPSRAGTAT